MLRVVVAVTLAASLLGVSMPAVDTARIDHADARVVAELEGLAATAERLRTRNDPSPPGTLGARRTVTLHLPGPSWGSAGLDSLSIPASPVGSSVPERTVVSWRVEGGSRTTRVLSAPVVGPRGGLTLEGGGTRQIVVELVSRGGEGKKEPVVRVRRPGFKSDAGTSGDHEVAGHGDRRPAIG